ncbi:MAG: amidohydrolase family protein, partial [Planctomycetota bacterium]
ELLAGGVGTVGDGFFHDAGVVALRETGQRGVFFREFFGVSAPDDGDYLAACERRIDEDLARVPGGLVGYGLAPHAPYTCPGAVLAGLAARAERDGLRLSIHVAESPEEDDFFRRRRGPMMARFDRGDRHDLGRSPVAALAARGALGPRTLLVHAVHVDEDDLDLIASSGATVVHCPGSNHHLGVGVAPIVALRARGIPLAIATDSAASRGKLDLFEEMRLAVFAQRAAARNATALDATAALEAATLGGARALGLEDRIGSLEVGKDADLAAVRLDRLRHRPCVDPVFALVFSAQTDDVLGVWVAGRRLHAREREA